MTTKKSGLGKGLGALLSAYEDYHETIKNSEGISQKGIEIEKLIPNPNQPRKIFNPAALEELAASIKTHGIIQPLVVNDQKDGRRKTRDVSRKKIKRKLTGGFYNEEKTY